MRRRAWSFQFRLTKLLLLIAISSVICACFAALPLMLALPVMSGLNLFAAGTYWFMRQRRLSKWMAATSLFFCLTLLLTDWGFSSPRPRIHIHWLSLSAACASELIVIVLWLSSGVVEGRLTSGTGRSRDSGSEQKSQLPVGAEQCRM